MLLSFVILAGVLAAPAVHGGPALHPVHRVQPKAIVVSTANGFYDVYNITTKTITITQTLWVTIRTPYSLLPETTVVVGTSLPWYTPTTTTAPTSATTTPATTSTTTGGSAGARMLHPRNLQTRVFNVESTVTSTTSQTNVIIRANNDTNSDTPVITSTNAASTSASSVATPLLTSSVTSSGAPSSTASSGAPSSTGSSGVPSSTATSGAPSSTVSSGAPFSTSSSGAPFSTSSSGAPSSSRTSSVASSTAPPSSSSTIRPSSTVSSAVVSSSVATVVRPPRDRFMNNSEVNAYVESLKNTNTGSFPKVKVVNLESGGVLVSGRPYVVPGVKNPKIVKARPVISIEAGFEANDAMSNAVAFLFIDYLLNSCTGANCLYDYEVYPQIVGQDAVDYAAASDPNWVKTRNIIEGSSCVGTNLLENFDGGDWDKGSSDPCSDLFRGENRNSAPQTKYQVAKASKKDDLRLSITLTKSGGRLSHPFAFNADNKLEDSEFSNRYVAVLEAYKKAAPSYIVGSYAGNHGVNNGHPLDYNYQQYKDYGYSLNVALNGSNTGNIDANTDQFIQGLNYMIDEAKKYLDFGIEYYE